MSETPLPPTTPARGTARVGRSRSRFDATLVAAVVVPLLAVGASALVDVDTPTRAGAAPSETPLTESSIVCPGGGGEVLVTSTSGEGGSVDVRSGGTEEQADLRPGRTTSVDLGERAAVVTGRDELAPGLVAGRFSTPLASFDCRAPVFDQWFTGVGAGARHRSTIQLVNPDEGRAVVDITVLGADGEVEAPLRGVTVEGESTRAVPLAEVLPRRDELTVRVTVVRGRIAASVRDAFRGVGNARSGDDGLASQAAPQTGNLLLGVPTGAGPRSLVIANPGTSQGRATLQLVTGDATFEPRDVEPIDLPPRSTVVVPVAGLLRRAGEGDEAPIGLQVDSTVPTTATLSVFVEGDLATAVPAVPLEGPGTAILPEGSKRLLLGDAASPGVVTVAARSGDGTALEEQRVEVGPGRAASVDLPDDARLITVTPARTSVAGVVAVVGSGGATIVRLREPATGGVVPDVRAGAP